MSPSSGQTWLSWCSFLATSGSHHNEYIWGRSVTYLSLLKNPSVSRSIDDQETASKIPQTGPFKSSYVETTSNPRTRKNTHTLTHTSNRFSKKHTYQCDISTSHLATVLSPHDLALGSFLLEHVLRLKAARELAGLPSGVSPPRVKHSWPWNNGTCGI